MAFWQRPYAFSGEEVEGHIVGDVNRHQTSVGARTTRRQLRSAWLQGAMATAFVSGRGGLTWSEFQLDLQSRILCDSVAVPKASTASSSSSAAPELGAVVPKTPPRKRSRYQEEREPEPTQLMPLTSKAFAVPTRPPQKAMPFVRRKPAPKAEAKAVSDVRLQLVYQVPPRVMPKVETKAAPVVPKAPIQGVPWRDEAAEARRAAAKARATRFLLRVQKPPVEDAELEAEQEPEFFQPGSLLHLLEPPRPVETLDVAEDEDESWGQEWPSPSA